MAKKRQEVAITKEEETVLDALSLDGAEVSPTSSAKECDGVEEFVDARFGPPMWSEKWPEWVSSKFLPNELDPNGYPYVYSIRRLCRLLLGPILVSKVEQVYPPQLLGTDDENLKFTRCKPVTVVYKLKILWQRPEDGGEHEVEFSDVADVMLGNTDEEFLRFPSSTAATRAEARCLRKALQLKRAAAEEMTKVQVEDTSDMKFSDVIFLNTLCERLDIDVIKYINSGKSKKTYQSLEEIPAGTGREMLKYLSELQRDMSKIPNSIKGYNKNWREQFNTKG